jgi:lanosterol synthase
MYGKYPHRGPLERAGALVMSKQLAVSLGYILESDIDEPCRRQDGSWPQEAIEGVFNKTVVIGYPNFKFSFTIWMLGRVHQYLANLS